MQTANGFLDGVALMARHLFSPPTDNTDLLSGALAEVSTMAAAANVWLVRLVSTGPVRLELRAAHLSRPSDSAFEREARAALEHLPEAWVAQLREGLEVEWSAREEAPWVDGAGSDFEVDRVLLLPLLSGSAFGGFLCLDLSGEGAGCYHRDSEELRRAAVIVGAYLRLEAERCRADRGERLLRAILNTVSETLLVIDENNAVALCNEVAASRLGTDCEGLRGKTSRAVLPDALASARQAVVEETRSSCHPRRFSDVRAGRAFDTRTYPVLDADGRAREIVVFSKDVTAVRDLGRNYRETDRRLRQLINEVPVGIALVAVPEFVPVLANRELCRLSGYSREELQRLALPKLAAPHARQHLLACLQRAIDGETARLPNLPFALGNCGEVTVDFAAWGEYVDGREVVVCVFRDVSEIRQARQGAAGQGEILRDLAHRLTDLQESERRRIVRHLHDVVAQDLATVKMKLQRATGGDRLDRIVAGAVHSLSETLGCLRSLYRDIRPVDLAEGSLVDAMRSYLDDVACELTSELRVKGRERKAERFVRVNLFRIFQEAVLNALKHAGATAVQVTIDFDRDRVALAIDDNGRGFDTEGLWQRLATTQHLGLVGILDRVRSLGGSLEIKSEPGEGTLVSVETPW